MNNMLECDVCGKDFHYKTIKHFSTRTDGHVHVCADCINKLKLSHYFIPESIVGKFKKKELTKSFDKLQKLVKILNSYDRTNAAYVILNLQMNRDETAECDAKLLAANNTSVIKVTSLAQAELVLQAYMMRSITALCTLKSVQLSECLETALAIYISDENMKATMTLADVDEAIENHQDPFTEYCDY